LQDIQRQIVPWSDSLKGIDHLFQNKSLRDSRNYSQVAGKDIVTKTVKALLGPTIPEKQTANQKIKQVLEPIIEHYKTMCNIQTLPRKLKLHKMISEICADELPDAKDLAKQVLKEVLNPQQSEKLTIKQKIKQVAENKSAQRKLAMLKKATRKKP
jgi:2-succinyl-5-enolpyruvyl-6-hydroxy-3-cyclohexene-1-carboxylate synthase